MTSQPKPVPVHTIGDPIEHEMARAVEDALRPPRLFPLYVASRMDHRGMWKHLRREWRAEGIAIVSSWIDVNDNHESQSPLAFSGAWIGNVREITEAKALLCFGEGKDVLRGALVEAGVAIGQHKPVIIVDSEVPADGRHPRWGSWQYHPLVHYASSLEKALLVLKRWTSPWEPSK